MRLTPLAYSLLAISGGLMSTTGIAVAEQTANLPTMVVSATGYK